MTAAIGIMDVEAYLVRRVRDCTELPDTRILTGGDLAHIEERAQAAPAVHIVHFGWRPVEATAQGMVQRIEHRFMTSVAVRNSRGYGGSALRQDAGPLLDQLLSGLLGHVLAPGVSGLRLSAGSGPRYIGNFAYFPLNWVCSTTHRGSP